MMNWKMLLTILTLAATLMSSSYTMLIPFLPVYLTKELGVTEHVNLWSGAVFSVTFLVSTFMAPIWGAMSDKGSRKLMAIRSAVLLSLAYTLGGLVQTPTQLFFVRVLQVPSSVPTPQSSPAALPSDQMGEIPPESQSPVCCYNADAAVSGNVADNRPPGAAKTPAPAP